MGFRIGQDDRGRQDARRGQRRARGDRGPGGARGRPGARTACRAAASSSRARPSCRPPARPSSSAPTSSRTTPARSSTSRRTTRRPCAPPPAATRLHRPDAGALVRRCRRRLRHGHQHGPLHRHRPDARRVPVPPPAGPAHARAGRHPGLPDDGPRGRQLRRRRHVQGHRVARHDAAAERRRLPEGLLQPLPGPDREPRPARHAGRRSSRTWSPRSTSRTSRTATSASRRRSCPARAPSASAPPAVLGAPLVNTTGEITAAQPVASIPFTGHRGADHPRDRRRHPVRLDRLHPGDQGPRRHHRCRRSTRGRARSSSTGR